MWFEALAAWSYGSDHHNTDPNGSDHQNVGMLMFQWSAGFFWCDHQAGNIMKYNDIDGNMQTLRTGEILLGFPFWHEKLSGSQAQRLWPSCQGAVWRFLVPRDVVDWCRLVVISRGWLVDVMTSSWWSGVSFWNCEMNYYSRVFLGYACNEMVWKLPLESFDMVWLWWVWMKRRSDSSHLTGEAKFQGRFARVSSLIVFSVAHACATKACLEVRGLYVHKRSQNR